MLIRERLAVVSPEVFRLSLRHLGHRTRKRLVHGPGPRERPLRLKMIGGLLMTIKIGQVTKVGQLFVKVRCNEARRL